MKKIKYNWILLGANKQFIENIINPELIEKNGMTFQILMLNSGHAPINNRNTYSDVEQLYYDIPLLYSWLYDLMCKYKEAFTFTSKCLAYVKMPTYEEKQMLIPDYFPRAKGRTFEQALIIDIDKPKQFEGNDVYPCFFYDYQNEDGTYTSTAIENNQDDFWAFYKFFGTDRIILDYKIRENAAN